MVQEETDKQPQDPTMFDKIYGSICLMQRKAEQKWAIEKPKLDNARRLRGTYHEKCLQKVGNSDASRIALQTST